MASTAPSADDQLHDRQPNASIASRREAGPAPFSSLALLAVLLVGLTITRLVGLRFSVVDLFYDEAQYWMWGQDLAFGYYSKPPLLAWLLAATRQVCGDAEWCIRAPAPLFHCATSLAVYFTARVLYDERTGFWASLLTALTTGITFSSRIISTDVPLLFFWTMALLAYAYLLVAPRKRWAVVLGLSIGLGLLSKYAMIYFIPGMLLAALANRRAREIFREPHVWAGLLVGTIVVLPNIIWNIGNSFMTFRHTGDLVLGEEFRPSIGRMLEFFGAQFGVFGPIVFGVMIFATVKWRSRELITQDRLMIAFFIVPVVLITLIAIGVHAYPNWASVSATSGLILTAALLLRIGRRGLLYGSLALGIVLQTALLAMDSMATRIALPFLKTPNPYNRTLGWRAYAERVGQLAEETGTPTIANDYRGDIAALRYYWRGRPQNILSWGTSDSPQFDVVHPLTPQATEPILFVTSCPDRDRVQPFYGSVEYLGQFTTPVGTTGRRGFFAYKLSQNRGEVGILPECRW
ncbi:ArnT family glycosyltransferase [Bradyrhizobium prioriisuperbiae]|uniref:ArnT family glycosyltransferase n=1 Tax=Bradyrhizobium prioriisuperbiae TaxID=2854389 RepID=UPI0028E6188C|nr:glycosyltransferase family 39 protein [Bradyrhizobium prioritasuperba]